MTEKARALLEQALQLSSEERERLAYELLQTVESEPAQFTPDQLEEIERRARAALAATSPPGDDWEVVLARLEKRFSKPAQS